MGRRASFRRPLIIACGTRPVAVVFRAGTVFIEMEYMMKRVILIVLGAWFAGAITGCVTQKDLYPYDEHMYRIEKQLAEQEKELLKSREEYKSELMLRKNSTQQIRNQSATLTATLDGMKQETRQLEGRLEELAYQLKQKNGATNEVAAQYGQRMDQLAAALENAKQRIAYLESYLGVEQPASRVEKPAGEKSGQSVSLPATEAELYQAAKSAFDKGDDETARAQFKAFIKKYSKSKNADNAQFWIAEIFYREQWYEKAILEYQKVIETYPRGNKAPDAMLKQGLAFYKLKDKANARLILKELIKKYPHTHAALIAGKKLKEI